MWRLSYALNLHLLSTLPSHQLLNPHMNGMHFPSFLSWIHLTFGTRLCFWSFLCRIWKQKTRFPTSCRPLLKRNEAMRWKEKGFCRICLYRLLFSKRQSQNESDFLFCCSELFSVLQSFNLKVCLERSTASKYPLAFSLGNKNDWKRSSKWTPTEDFMLVGLNEKSIILNVFRAKVS